MTKDFIAQLAHEIMLANYHKPGIKILKLYQINPFYFEELKNEIFKFSIKNPFSSVNNSNHVTNWTKPQGEVRQYSLFNRTGNTEDTSDDHNEDDGSKRFFYSRAYPNLAKIIETMRCLGLMGFRLNYLGPGATLSPHEEHIVHDRSGKIKIRMRFHIPVITNSLCRVFLDGDFYKMDPGFIYLFNNGCVHSSENLHEFDERLHLVWDMMLTEISGEAMLCGGLTGKDSDLFIPVSSKVVQPCGHLTVNHFETYPSETPFEKAEKGITIE